METRLGSKVVKSSFLGRQTGTATKSEVRLSAIQQVIGQTDYVIKPFQNTQAQGLQKVKSTSCKGLHLVSSTHKAALSHP